ncbi:MAG TPA: ABC transporter permease [Casimicrobiaceae bacterium]
MLKLALRNVFRQRFRTAMTLAAIAFGVVGLILSGGFIRDIIIQLGEALIHSQSGHLQVARRGYFSYGSRSPDKYMIADANAVRQQLAGLPEVEDVLGRVHFTGLLNNGRTDWPVTGEGVEPAKESKLGSFIRLVAGRQLQNRDNFGVLIGQGVAQALKLAPGDRVTLLANTAEGALNSRDLEVVGVFQSFSKDYDARAIRLPLDAAGDLLDTKGVNVLVVSLKRTSDTDSVAKQIVATLEPAGFEVKSWVQLNDFYEKTVALYEQQFGFLQVIILFMVLLSVTNSVNMSIFERVGEFGTMLALGNRIRDVRQLIVTESALLGTIGGLLGVVVGVLLSIAISTIGIPMPPPPNANIGYTAFIRIVPSGLTIAFAVGLLATVCASLLPAARVSRMSAAEALRANV